MVFEQFLQSDNVKKHALIVFLIGILYVIVSYIVFLAFNALNMFSQSEASLVILFATTLLLVPSFYVLLNLEEKIESREGLRHFYYNHKDIFKICIFFFLGIFFAFLMLGSMQAYTLDYQTNSLENTGVLESIEHSDDYVPSFDRFSAFITHNLLIVIVSFIFSLFYGAGALFLIVFNASVFAAFIGYIMRMSGNAWQVLSIFLIHMVPEIAGFLVAAIAGGVVSRAIVREEFGSEGFRNVMRDAFVLLLISIALIIIAAALETWVTPILVKGFI